MTPKLDGTVSARTLANFESWLQSGYPYRPAKERVGRQPTLVTGIPMPSKAVDASSRERTIAGLPTPLSSGVYMLGGIHVADRRQKPTHLWPRYNGLSLMAAQ
jgi:hypothetical protein